MANLLLAWICIFAVTSSVFAGDLPLLKVSERIRDERKPIVPVGGDDIGGFLLGDPSARVNPETLIALLPSHSEPALCARIVSRDGQYKGGFAYDVRNAQSGDYRLQLNSDHKSWLGSLKADELVVSLWLGAACQWAVPPGVTRVAVAWQPGANRSNVFVFVNAGNLDARLFDPQRPKERQISICKDLRPSSLSSLSFNRQCQYAVSGGPDHSFEFQTVHFGSLQDKTPVLLRLP